jgi:hypothetical protein
LATGVRTASLGRMRVARVRFRAKFRMLAAFVCLVELSTACGGNAAPVSTAGVLPAGSAAPQVLGPAKPHRVRVEPADCPKLGPSWAVGFKQPQQGATFTQSEAGDVAVEISGKAPDEQSPLWVKLDEHVPRRVDATQLRLRDLFDELGGIGVGPHTLVLFSTMSDGRALFDSGNRPLLAVTSFQVVRTAGEGVPFRPAQQLPILLTPFGTYNGSEELKSVRLQLSAFPDGGDVRLKIQLPSGNTEEQIIATGCYLLSGFVSGDYRFTTELLNAAPGATTPGAGRATITVNLEEPGAVNREP